MHRITLSLPALVLLGTIGLGYSLTSFYNLLREPSDQPVDSYIYAKTLGEQLAHTLDAVSDRRAFIDRWNEQTSYFIEIVGATQFSISEPLLQELRESGPLAVEDDHGIRLNFYLEQTDEVLVISAPPSETNGQAHLQIVFTALFYTGLLVLALVWLAPLLYRLRKLRSAAVTFGKGQLGTRIPVTNASYIADIEVEFNRMADQVENLVEDVKLLSSALSHEMRTPLAKLRLGIDALEEQENPATRHCYQQRLSRTVDQLTQLVESTLEFSRMDYALADADRHWMDLAPVVQSCIAKCQLTDMEIHFDMSPEICSIQGNELYFSLMITNLIENAAKYGDGRIVLHLKKLPAAITVSVEDNGPGFASDANDYVFKPFQRGKVERNKAGFGLGLAVVERIVSWHGGTIVLDRSERLGGARVMLRFEAH